MCMWCILLKILSSQSSLKKFVRHRVQAPYLWTTYTIDLRNLSILNRLCEVGREETLLSCWILASHQPSLLLQHWMIISPCPCQYVLLSHLLLRVLVLDDVDDLSHLEGQLIHVLGLVFVGGLHLVQHTWGQVVRGGAWNTTALKMHSVQKQERWGN